MRRKLTATRFVREPEHRRESVSWWQVCKGDLPSAMLCSCPAFAGVVALAMVVMLVIRTELGPERLSASLIGGGLAAALLLAGYLLPRGRVRRIQRLVAGGARRQGRVRAAASGLFGPYVACEVVIGGQVGERVLWSPPRDPAMFLRMQPGQELTFAIDDAEGSAVCLNLFG